MWPYIVTFVSRVDFVAAAYDNLDRGQDAATRSANRVAETIGAA